MIKLEKENDQQLKKILLSDSFFQQGARSGISNNLPLIKTNPKPKKVKFKKIRIVRLVFKYSEKIAK